MTKRRAVDVVLIGPRLAHNENLGLGFVAAALRRAGLGVEVCALNSWVDMAPIARRVCALAPRLVGLALADGGSAMVPLGMGELLRTAGYRGHITAGGAFATLARTWLLDRYRWLDSVVRGAGEVPAVRLARELTGRGTGLPLTGLGGISTRDGDGAPAPVLDSTPLELAPEHGPLPEIVGYRMAHLSATRGCPGRCDYCGPAALQRLALTEGVRQGCSGATLRQTGVGAVRRRPLAQLCDEMAELWHERSVRYFYFVDEHLLPRREAEALQFLSRWQRLLADRGVDRPCIGGMLRADRLTPAMIERFVDVGLVRCFVGVELLSREELRAYRRGGDVEQALGAMRQLERLGVATVCNVMLVHPYATAPSLERALAVLRTMGDTPFEATRMQIYHGTGLHERLAAEGRLTGNPIRYSYDLRDARLARFAALFARLRAEAVGNYSLAFQIHDVRLALNLARRQSAGRWDELCRRARLAAARVNALRTDTLVAAWQLAAAAPSAADDELIGHASARSQALSQAIDRIERQLGRQLSWSGSLFAPMKAAAATAATIAFVSAGAASACASPQPAPTKPSAAVAIPSTTDADAARSPDPAAPPPGAATSPSSTDGGSTRVAGDAGTPRSDRASCASTDHGFELQRKIAAIAARSTCISLRVGRRSDTGTLEVGPHSVEIPLVERTRHGPNYLEYCSVEPAVLERVRVALEAELDDADRACLVVQPTFVSGRDRELVPQLNERVRSRCQTAAMLTGLVIEIDERGRVSAVRPNPRRDRVSTAELQCVERALRGLTFPCLGGSSICQGFVIIE